MVTAGSSPRLYRGETCYYLAGQLGVAAVGEMTLRKLLWMKGADDRDHDLFLAIQEDAWERTSRTLAAIHNGSLLTSRSLGGTPLKESDFKTADDCNDWLRVPGNTTDEEERRRHEDEIIAERKKEAQERRAENDGPK